MADTDSQLLQIASLQPNSIPEVVAAFEAIDSTLPDSDGLKWFNHLYLEVTKSVDQSMGTRTWEQPAWMARLDVLFAGLYLDALAGYLKPERSAPECWRVFFDARRDARLQRIQFALAGMNAHIDNDLCIAVARTCKEFGEAPVHQSAKYRDFTKVNSLLDALIDQEKRELMVSLLGETVPAIGAVEDMLASGGMRKAREIAWTNSEVLSQLGNVPDLAHRFLECLDHTSAVAGRALLLPLKP